jgi:hypothetical protein
MPDKWEYPWYAAWDLAFHVLALSVVDEDFGKQQLDLMLGEQYLHPNGQLPADEWNFGDVNPPVHAWSTIFTYRLEKARHGKGDLDWLERSFHELLLNFIWWVNRKDRAGNNAFEGGFLGLDNIGVFDRSAPLPTGGYLEQADGTAWMALFCQNMLEIAAELTTERPGYADLAVKFAEHFLWIASAMMRAGGDVGMWDEADGFFYDVPPAAGWHRSASEGALHGRAASAVRGDRLRREGVSEPLRHPVPLPLPGIPGVVPAGGVRYRHVRRELQLARADLDARQRAADPRPAAVLRVLRTKDFTVECPTGSGRSMTLYEVAEEIARRQASLFLRGDQGRRPVYGGTRKFQEDPHWRDLPLFYEYFHGDNGAGLGASHQTGGTGIVARMMHLFASTTPEQILEIGKAAGLTEVGRVPSGRAGAAAVRHGG